MGLKVFLTKADFDLAACDITGQKKGEQLEFWLWNRKALSLVKGFKTGSKAMLWGEVTLSLNRLDCKRTCAEKKRVNVEYWLFKVLLFLVQSLGMFKFLPGLFVGNPSCIICAIQISILFLNWKVRVGRAFTPCKSIFHLWEVHEDGAKSTAFLRPCTEAVAVTQACVFWLAI